MNVGDPREPTVRIPPQEGRRSINVLYLFSCVECRASIADFLMALCEKEGVGMNFFDLDIHVGGSAHDLLDGEKQEDYIAHIPAGKFDVIILCPPRGSWSIANWANNKDPPPCRERFQPWGFADNKKGQRGYVERGNAFVHFSIRAIVTAQQVKAQGS